MKSTGISTKSFGFTEPSVPQMIEPSKSLFDKFTSPPAAPAAPAHAPPTPAPAKPVPSAPVPQTPAAPLPTCGLPANAGSALDALLAQVEQAKHSHVKATLIAAYVARHYFDAQVPTCRMPQVVDPKPPLVQQPLVEKRFTGDELVRQLDAGGAAIGERNGAYGVDSGRCGNLAAEIDPGESLTFHVPNGGRAAGGRVTVDKLFNGGPDRHRQEQATIEVWDNDRLVKTIDIRAYSATNGQQSVDVDVAFTKLVFKAKGEYKGHGEGSDFALRDVTIRYGGEAPPVQAQPYPLPNPKGETPPIQAQPYPYPLPNPKGETPPIQAQPYPFPQPEPPYIGIPRFGDGTILPVSPPTVSKDPFVVSAARRIGRLAELIDRSRLPEGLQNTLLDRIATLLGQLHVPRDTAGQRSMVLNEVASLIRIIDENVPNEVARRPNTAGKGAVMEHLKAMLFNVARGRGDTLDVTSTMA